MSQPQWKFVNNLGDVNFLENGGFLVFRDETGVYDPEVEMIEVDEDGNKPSWTIYRFTLESCMFASPIIRSPVHDFSNEEIWDVLREWRAKGESVRKGLIKELLADKYGCVIYHDGKGNYCCSSDQDDSPGILSNNQFYPNHPVWFNDDVLGFAEALDMDLVDFINWFTSDDPTERALAWREVAQYWGPTNLDPDPLVIKSRKEMRKRYKDILEK